MKILLVHQNFPGQFPHLSQALIQRGHQVLALTDEKNQRQSPIEVVRYKTPEPVKSDGALGRSYSNNMERAYLAARGARALRDRFNFYPDLILGHSGWGETLLLQEIWPEAKLLIYAELLYRTRGQDVGFDPELQKDSDESRFMTIGRSAHLIQSIVQADAAIAPTRYQADSFPPELRSKITVIHDGIETNRVCPNPDARLTLPDGTVLKAGDEVLSYVSRSLEPYRGFHIFMRALPQVLRERPNAQVVIVGGEGVSYGSLPADGGSWKAKILDELQGQLDLSRIHFMGRVAYEDYLSLIQVGRVHCYLTYPFVLSWSLTETMSAGGYVVASDTAPVRELITDGKNGRLVPFFDVEALSKALIKGLEGDPDAPRLRQTARQTILDSYDLQRHSLPKQIAWIEAHAKTGAAVF